jgi:opacity protein-like surface antigen
MDLEKRTLTRILLLAALVVGLLAAAPALAATAYVEGVVTGGPEPDCVLVKDRQGNAFVLEGTGWYGVIGNDYVRLEGTIVPDTRCGASSGIQVSDVSTIWRDDTRKVIVYERSKASRFADWVRAHREREWREWEREHHIPPPPPQQ